MHRYLVASWPLSTHMMQEGGYDRRRRALRAGLSLHEPESNVRLVNFLIYSRDRYPALP